MNNRYDINQVTLIATDCTDRIKDTINALKICTKSLNFGDVVLLTNRKPRNLPEFINYKHIKKITNINEYSRFMFLELYQYFDTSHCLTIQDHAYIINPELWNNDWLNYDYIRAPWLYQANSYVCHDTGEHVRVGNGGFSLRSKKLTSIPKENKMKLLQEQGFYNEDGNINCYWRVKMLAEGIKYAPIEVASKFSYENLMSENYGIKPFGFHRNYPIKTWNDND